MGNVIRPFDLENRLVKFSVSILKFAETVPSRKSTSHLCNQLIRSGTSVALNYGEAQAAESKKDFIHKMSIILKELRETRICLKIIEGGILNQQSENFVVLASENNQLIAIFTKSIQTARGK